MFIGSASARNVIPAHSGPDTTEELAQGRADRSKTATVIFRRINTFEPPI
jgi:hypothetical protein